MMPKLGRHGSLLAPTTAMVLAPDRSARNRSGCPTFSAGPATGAPAELVTRAAADRSGSAGSAAPDPDRCRVPADGRDRWPGFPAARAPAPRSGRAPAAPAMGPALTVAAAGRTARGAGLAAGPWRQCP